MTLKYIFFINIVAILLLTSCQSPQTSALPQPVPQAIQGVLDLSAWDIEQSEFAMLAGEWAFYWQVLYLPHQLTWPPAPNNHFVSVPNNWHVYQIDGLNLPAEGFATYQLQLKLPSTTTTYGLYLDGVNYAYTIWLDDEQIVQAGQVSKKAETMTAFNKPQAIFFRPQQETVNLVIQISNYHHRNPGIRNAPVIGLATSVHQYQLQQWFIESLLLGGLILITIYHFVLYLFRPQNKSPLYFGLLCALVASRVLVTGQNIILDFWPTAPWELLFRLEYLTFYFAMPLLHLFYYQLYPDVFKKWPMRLSFFLALLYTGYMLIMNTLTVSYTISSYQLISLIQIIYIIPFIIILMIKRREGAGLLGLSTLVGMITVSIDILYYQGILPFGKITSFGFLTFIFVQAILISQRFSKTFYRVEELSDDLQQQNLRLRESEQKYRAIFEESNDLIFITNLEGQILDVNAIFETLLGYQLEEVPQINVGQFYVNEADRLKIRSILLTQGLIKDFEVQLYRKDRQIIDVLLTATVRETVDGKPIGFQGIIRDITAQKQAEQERFKLTAIQQELSIAHDIQESLLPPAQPDWPDIEVICFTTPAKEVGGDFYQYYRFEEKELIDKELGPPGSIIHKYAFAVGDVSGKGVSAALLMATSLSQFDASLSLKLSPTERMAHLDKTISPYTKPRRQNCAMCYVEAEIEHKMRVTKKLPLKPEELGLYADTISFFRVVNAGCIPPYIKRRDGAVEQPDVGGFALGQGLGAMVGYDPHVFELYSGDMMILTSDGVVEANNNEGEMLGFERLEQIVRNGPTIQTLQGFDKPSKESGLNNVNGVEAMLTHLKQEIFAFMGEAEQHDDMTIVVIRV